METCCLKCKKNTENLNSKIFKTKNDRLLCNQDVVIMELKNQDL